MHVWGQVARSFNIADMAACETPSTLAASATDNFQPARVSALQVAMAQRGRSERGLWVRQTDNCPTCPLSGTGSGLIKCQDKFGQKKLVIGTFRTAPNSKLFIDKCVNFHVADAPRLTADLTA